MPVMNAGVALVTGVVGLVFGVGIGWWLPRGGEPVVEVVESPAGVAAVAGVDVGEPGWGRGYVEMFGDGVARAAEGVEVALSELDGLDGARDRRAFLRGMFGQLALTMSAAEVLEVAAGLEGDDRRAALWATVGAWTEGRSDEHPMVEGWVQRFGVEAGLAMGLAYDEGVTAEIGDAWAEAFGESTGAGVLLGTLAAVRVAEDFDAAMKYGEGLDGWEREVFLRTMTESWSESDPEAAWAFVRDNVDETNTVMPERVGAGVIERWAQKDFVAAEAAFGELTGAEERRLAAGSLAKAKAGAEGTVAGVEWAQGLADAGERESALAAVAETAPQGIGVALMLEDGFLKVGAVVEGGPAARNGELREGDRIVEVDPGNGEFEGVYGQGLPKGIELIKGEAGSTLRLRVLREVDGGGFEDRVIEMQREQLLLGG